MANRWIGKKQEGDPWGFPGVGINMEKRDMSWFWSDTAMDWTREEAGAGQLHDARRGCPGEEDEIKKRRRPEGGGESYKPDDNVAAAEIKSQ